MITFSLVGFIFLMAGVFMAGAFSGTILMCLMHTAGNDSRAREMMEEQEEKKNG